MPTNSKKGTKEKRKHRGGRRLMDIGKDVKKAGNKEEQGKKGMIEEQMNA